MALAARVRDDVLERIAWQRFINRGPGHLTLDRNAILSRSKPDHIARLKWDVQRLFAKDKIIVKIDIFLVPSL